MTKRMLEILVLFILLAACQPAADSPPLFEPLEGDRDQLTRADLLATDYAEDGPVDNRYLAPPAGAATGG